MLSLPRNTSLAYNTRARIFSERLLRFTAIPYTVGLADIDMTASFLGKRAKNNLGLIIELISGKVRSHRVPTFYGAAVLDPWPLADTKSLLLLDYVVENYGY